VDALGRGLTPPGPDPVHRERGARVAQRVPEDPEVLRTEVVATGDGVEGALRQLLAAADRRRQMRLERELALRRVGSVERAEGRDAFVRPVALGLRRREAE